MQDKKRQKSNKKLDYAYLPFSSALSIPDAIIFKCGGEARDIEVLEQAVGIKGGALRERIVNAKRYGLIEGRGILTSTKRSLRILEPTTEGESDLAISEAIMSIPLFSEIAIRFKGQIPEDKVFFRNMLAREYGVPKNHVGRVMNAIKKNFLILSALKISDAYILSEEQLQSVKENKWPLPQKGIDAIISNSLTLHFGKHRHDFEITSETDWEMVEAVLNGLKKKWIKSKEERKEVESE